MKSLGLCGKESDCTRISNHHGVCWDGEGNLFSSSPEEPDNVDDNDELTIHERSGKVTSNNKLVSFLYILLRDHVLPGDMENIMKNHVPTAQPTSFSNGWLAEYAKDLTERLK